MSLCDIFYTITPITEHDNTARGSHCQRHAQTSIPDHLGFYSLRSVLDWFLFFPGVTYPSGAVQKQLLDQVYGEANINPSDVAYVEAHGTGTKAGDPEELNAITSVFCKNRPGPLLIGSVKSNMGDPEPIKRSFTPGVSPPPSHCNVFHWVNKTFTSARHAQHPFVGTLLSLSSVCRSDLGSGGEAEEGSCCVIRSLLGDYLIYRHSPVLSAHLFSYPSLSSRVFRRDPIHNDLVLFPIIGVGGVRHHLKASGMTRTHYLLLKHY